MAYSNLAGSFERKTTQPIEAEYIFPNYTALINFYASNPISVTYNDPQSGQPVTYMEEGNEWRKNLHEGLLKIVKDNSDDTINSSGKQSLYFSFPNGTTSDGLTIWEFRYLISDGDIFNIHENITNITNNFSNFDEVTSEVLNDLNCRIEYIETNCCGSITGNVVKSVTYSGTDLTVTYTDNTIQVYTISSGTPTINVVQILGQSTTDVMSQKAVTDALNSKVNSEPGKGLTSNDFTTDILNKINNIEANAEVNVQSDWNETDTLSDAYILNKPTINNINLVQTTGTSTTDAMSQNAITTNLNNKLDKVTSTTSFSQAYIKETSGGQNMIDVSTSSNPNTIALRKSSGQLTSTDPQTSLDVVNLQTLNNLNRITSINGATGPGISLIQGDNINITNSGNSITISSTGGGGQNVVQTTGSSTTDVMSQKAVTDALDNKEASLCSFVEGRVNLDLPNRLVTIFGGNARLIGKNFEAVIPYQSISWVYGGIAYLDLYQFNIFADITTYGNGNGDGNKLAVVRDDLGYSPTGTIYYLGSFWVNNEVIVGLTATYGSIYVNGALPYDSPLDGKTYGRNNGTWAEITGGGSGPSIVQTTGTSTDAVMSQNAVTQAITPVMFLNGYSGNISKSQLSQLPLSASIYVNTGGGETGPFNIGFVSGATPGMVMNITMGPSSGGTAIVYTINLPETWSDSNYSYLNPTGITSIQVTPSKLAYIRFRFITSEYSRPNMIVESVY